MILLENYKQRLLLTLIFMGCQPSGEVLWVSRETLPELQRSSEIAIIHYFIVHG